MSLGEMQKSDVAMSPANAEKRARTQEPNGAWKQLSKKHSLGQNFLSQETLLRQLLEWSRLSPGDRVFEVGAGAGALTEQMIEAGAVVFSAEIDERLFEPLASRFKSACEREQLAFYFADALTLDWSGVKARLDRLKASESQASARGAQKGESYRMIANLPYYLTRELIQKAYAMLWSFDSFSWMLQREAADRLLAPEPGETGYKAKLYGPLSVMTHAYAASFSRHKVPRHAFSPQPRVDSDFVCIFAAKDRFSPEIAASFLDFVLLCFAQRRKTLQSQFKKYANGNKNLEAKLAAGLASLHLPSHVRAEELTFQQFYALYQILEMEGQGWSLI